MESWQTCPGGQPHRTLGQAAAVATWLNSQKDGKGRWTYRAVTLDDGTHRVQRAPNPQSEAAPSRR